MKVTVFLYHKIRAPRPVFCDPTNPSFLFGEEAKGRGPLPPLTNLVHLLKFLLPLLLLLGTGEFLQVHKTVAVLIQPGEKLLGRLLTLAGGDFLTPALVHELRQAEAAIFVLVQGSKLLQGPHTLERAIMPIGGRCQR